MDSTTKKPHVVRGRSAARLAAVQALYQLEQEPTPTQKVITEFMKHRFTSEIDGVRYVSTDTNLFQKIVNGVIDGEKELDELITSVLADDWRMERVEAVVRAILRAATFELRQPNEAVPTPVIINEYVELAKDFYSGRESAFINASLDRLAKIVRPADN